ncbi:MAG TPA: hypothetical protein VIL98_11115 [Gaiellaceae bacterium]
MDERYPIGDTTSVAVAVFRHERHDAGYPMWSASIGLRGGEATVSVPGHYPTVLAQRLRAADAQFAHGTRLGRDEYLDLTALARDGDETLALSSTARSPVRVTIEVPRTELEPLAQLLDDAQQLIEELRQGLGLVPDSLPDAL